jgi:hypothetical protein
MTRSSRTDKEMGSVGIALAVACVLLMLNWSQDAKLIPQPDPSSPQVVTGLFSDVRLRVPAALHEQLVAFIKTGKLSSGKFGVDTTAVRSIDCKPGVLTFQPPINVTYTGGLLKGGTTVKEIRIDSDGQILVDVVNSPIDVIVEGDN